MRSQRSKEAAAEDTALYVHSAAFVFPLYLDTYVSTFLEYTFVSVRSAPLYLVGCLIQDSSKKNFLLAHLGLLVLSVTGMYASLLLVLATLD